MTQDTQTSAQPKRCSELDAMGMLVVVGLMFFHTAMIFYPGDFFIKNAPPSWEISQLVALTFVSFSGLWGMPLMFLIAGIAIWFSLRKRTAAEFVRERVRRILVPFVVGLLVIVPPQVYYAALQRDPTYSETYLQFLPQFFNVRFDLGSAMFIKGAPPGELFHLAHLWFLIYLFVFTLLLLPLFLYLRKPAGQCPEPGGGRRLIERWATFCARPWAIYLMALPVAVIEPALGTGLTGGWSGYVYIPFLAYGFLFAADARFEQAARRHRKSALLLGIVAFLVYLGGFYVLSEVGDVDPWTDYGLGSLLLRFFKGVTGWFWIVAIMGLASGARREQPANPGGDANVPPPEPPSPPRKPSLRERVVEYAGEAQLPFYVLHQTPIVVIGFYVVQWEVSTMVKYIVITLSSLVVTLLLYDIGVRRARLTRFLFGMRSK